MTAATERLCYTVLALPFDEQRALLKVLGDTVRRKEAEMHEERMRPGGRTDELLAAAAEAVGVPITRRSQREEQVLGRMFVLDQLVSEGYTLTRASALIGKDHSSGTHLRQRMAFMRKHPAAFSYEMALYDKFQRLIKK